MYKTVNEIGSERLVEEGNALTGDDAITKYTLALEKNPANNEALYRRGMVYYYRSEFYLAIHDLKMALNLSMGHRTLSADALDEIHKIIDDFDTIQQQVTKSYEKRLTALEEAVKELQKRKYITGEIGGGR